MADKDLNLFFKDERLQMTHAGRLLVRLISYAAYAITAMACVIFLLTDVKWLFGAGILLLLFLLEEIKYFGQAKKSFSGKKLRSDINLADYISPSAFAILEYAFERALIFGGSFDLFVLKKIAEKRNIKIALSKMGIVLEEFSNKIDEMLKASLAEKKDAPDKEKLLAEIEKIVILAAEQAIQTQEKFIGPKDIFAALSNINNPEISRIFQFFDIETGDLENALIFSRFHSQFRWLKVLPASLGGFAHAPYKVRHRVMNRAWSARPTPTLDQYSEDLTDYARTEKIGFLVGHHDECGRMIDILSRPGKPNVLLLGEPGAGKETIISHLAFKIIKDEVPPQLFDKRLVKLQISSLVAGAEQSELQARVRKIIDEIVKAGNIILVIPDIHNLAKASVKGAYNMLDAFLPAISSSAFSVIGATYSREYRQFVEPHTDFAQAFEIVKVEEISPEDAIKILIYESIILEKQSKIKIAYGAVKQAVILAGKYFRDKLLPSSAQDLLKEALANAGDRGDKSLDADDVIDAAQRRVNIPLKQAKTAEAQKLLNLEDIIHQRLIDQEEAVKAVARALREYRSGLSRKGGPIAAFLFVGPTGVGKTELSKILAGAQFGSKDAMVRFDMSEYQDKQSIFRFIGSPDGATSGALTDAVAQKPYCLVLLDEFEKANSDILNLFLQVFDDGRLTDNSGRTVDFQNTIIIATSNANSDFIKEQIEAGKTVPEISEELKKKLSGYFKPELINRFSNIIVFKNLSPEDTIAVAKIMLGELIGEAKTNQAIELGFSDEAVKKIAEWGYDPVFGARPLRGVISDKVRSALAEKILKQEIVKGAKVSVELKGEDLIFNIN